MLNIYPYPIFPKKILFVFACFCFFNSSFCQKNNDIWNELLQNNRQKALELSEKLDENDIESILLKKIVLMENGIMKSDPQFIESISKHPNFENYLFASWFSPFVFNDYIKNGFESLNFKMINHLDPKSISNSTVRNSLTYLQGISKRHQDDWEAYYEDLSKINAINQWEYCGVFENLNSSGIDISYEPEFNALSSKLFDARSRGKVTWYENKSYREVYQFFTNHTLDFGSGVHYAQTFIESDAQKRVHIKLGKGGLNKVWLNDVLIHEDQDKNITEMDAFTYAVTLQKGVNRILVKSASNSDSPYFILRLETENGTPVEGINITFNNKNYIPSTSKFVNLEFFEHKIEQFFEQNLLDDSLDNSLNRFCLFFTYYRNGRVEKAIKILNDWMELYPNSSFLKSCLITCYSKIGDNNSTERLKDNIKRLDPNYYLSLLLDLENFNELIKLDIKTYESKLNKIGGCVDYQYIKTSAELFVLFRQNDRDKMKEKLNDLLIDPNLPSTVKAKFSEFYSLIFNDDDTAISTLEKFDSNEYNYNVKQYLSYYYKKQNRLEDAIQVYVKALSSCNDNSIIYELVSLLQDVGQFERSLTYIEQALSNFPNSYIFTKFKGNAYVQLGKKKEAIKLFEDAFERNPSDLELRSKIYDLKNKENPLDQFHLKDGYEYIKSNRNTISHNNYGVNILLDQTDILNYQKGGGEYKTTLIYEVTSQNGIDIFKEYNLGLSGSYIIHKSEIVKPNEETIPASKSGSNLVFDGLEIGDVIYIDYQKNFIRTGRFYNDYIYRHNFNSYHPALNYTYRVLTTDKKINYITKNGDVPYKSYKLDDLFVHEWKKTNVSGLSISENYMPAFADVATYLHISSIDSWDEIALWYSDLVRKQIKFDDITKNTFNEIFPDGFLHLSETERAKKIYYYITENFNYSHVSFKQSGFVPQKPSKTIQTKLGDCKDFSALFLVLAKEAQLNTKLVLILTSDYGKGELILPSTDFNHCIAMVEIDGEEQFLELTDKYLPFKSLPMSLREATALEIPYNGEGSNNSGLFHLKDKIRMPANFVSAYTMKISDNNSRVDLTNKITGHLASYYISLFENKGEVLKEDIEKDLINRASETVNLIEIDNVNIDKDNGEITYTTEVEIDLKINKIGKLFAFKAPYFLNPYNQSIINSESRTYPINYINYENADSYNEMMTFKLSDGNIFVEIPEDIDLKFKGHHFKIAYDLKNPNELAISINSTVNSLAISPEDYQEFKEYVEKVLDTRETFILYKKDGNG